MISPRNGPTFPIILVITLFCVLAIAPAAKLPSHDKASVGQNTMKNTGMPHYTEYELDIKPTDLMDRSSYRNRTGKFFNWPGKWWITLPALDPPTTTTPAAVRGGGGAVGVDPIIGGVNKLYARNQPPPIDESRINDRNSKD